MIRPAGSSAVTTLSTSSKTLTRLFNSSTTVREQEWGLLRRRSEIQDGPREDAISSSGEDDRDWDEPSTTARTPFGRHGPSAPMTKYPVLARKQPVPWYRQKQKDPESPTTLTIHGLSPSLHARDFRRILPQGLSSWSEQITEVRQFRRLKTLEPSGSYALTFPNAAAAETYRDLLTRLHALSKHKVSSKSPLWESTIPALVRQGNDNERLNQLERLNVIVPGTVGWIRFEKDGDDVVRTRWDKVLAAISRIHGWDTQGRDIFLLLEAYPPKIAEAELERMIELDGEAKRMAWDVSKPVRVKTTAGKKRTAEPSEQPLPRVRVKKTPEKETGRFLLAFADMSEAQSFHRHWNHRLVEMQHDNELPRTLIHTSIIV